MCPDQFEDWPVDTWLLRSRSAYPTLVEAVHAAQDKTADKSHSWLAAGQQTQLRHIFFVHKLRAQAPATAGRTVAQLVY